MCEFRVVEEVVVEVVLGAVFLPPIKGGKEVCIKEENRLAPLPLPLPVATALLFVLLEVLVPEVELSLLFFSCSAIR